MTSSSTEHTIHVMLLGDSGIGKTSLARTMTEGSFPTADNVNQYSSSSRTDVFLCNNDTVITTYDKNSYYLHLYDLVPDESEIAQIIQSKKKETVVCYLCFDLCGPASFNRIKLKWFPLIKKLKISGHIYVVGLKEDLIYDAGTQKLLSSEGLQPIRDSVASQVADEIGAVSFSKISSLKYLGIQDLKEKTVFNVMDTSASLGTLQRKNRPNCSIM